MLAPSRRALLVLSLATAVVATCNESNAPSGPNGPGPATQMAIHAGQGDSSFVAAAVTTRPAVIVKDVAGVPVPGVTVTFAITGGGGTITGSTPATGADGVATVGSWTLGTVPGPNTLTATAAGLAGSPVTFTATARAGPASQLDVSSPAGTTAGTVLDTVQVTVRDAHGNTVTSGASAIAIALVDGTAGAGATLGGTVSRTSAAGLATFSDLTINLADTGYRLIVSSSGLSSDTTAPFDVGPGSPAQLAFLVEPSTAVAGSAIGPPVQVAVLDAHGNLVTTATTDVNVGITSGTGSSGAVLLGTTTRMPSNGVAAFDDLMIERAGLGYTLTASAAGLGADTSAEFGVGSGPAVRLAFTSQPSSTTAGDVLSPALTVAVQDSWRNTVGTGGAISLLPGSSCFGDGTVFGTFTRAAIGGIAVFDNIVLTRAGLECRIVATAAGLTPDTTAPILITPDAPARLSFAVQPTFTGVGAPITPPVVVEIHDTFGNLVTDAAAVVGLALGANPSGGTLSGTTETTAENGVATFPDLRIDKAGTSYTLTATSGVLTGTTSISFDVGTAPHLRLVFLVQPANATAGTVINPAVEVSIEDAFGNRVVWATDAIRVRLGMNPTGGTVSGTTTVNAVAGVATFGDLSIDKAGAAYTLVATALGIDSGSSTIFDILPPPPIDSGSSTVFDILPPPSTSPTDRPTGPRLRAPNGQLGETDLQIRPDSGWGMRRPRAHVNETSQSLLRMSPSGRAHDRESGLRIVGCRARIDRLLHGRRGR